MPTVDWVPERRFAVVTLTNGFGTLYGSATCAINAYLAPASAPQLGGSCPQKKEHWPGFVGHYEGHSYIGEPMRFDVQMMDGALLPRRHPRRR